MASAEAEGRRPRRSFLAGALASVAGAAWGFLRRPTPAEATTFLSRYRGQVVDVRDPLQLGRIQVNVPDVLGSTLAWAAPSTPYAGTAVGLFLLPPVGANVWVEFEQGDANFPVWVGGFWSAGEPPVQGYETKILRTDSNSITLSDSRDSPGISIEAPSVSISGNASFSRSGRAVVKAGRRSKRVGGVALTLDSVVLATLQEDVAGLQIQGVQTNPADGAFTLYLNQTAGRNVAFGWLAID